MTVTNQNDKEVQLGKLQALSDFTGRLFGLRNPTTAPMPDGGAGGEGGGEGGAGGERGPSGDGGGTRVGCGQVVSGEESTAAEIFISLRFGEAMEQGEELQRRLEARGVKAYICDAAPGANLLNVIAAALDGCQLAVILATETYAMATERMAPFLTLPHPFRLC